MLMIYKNEIRGGMCNAVYRSGEADNKYMKKFDKNVPASYLEYLDGWKKIIYQNLMKNL